MKDKPGREISFTKAHTNCHCLDYKHQTLIEESLSQKVKHGSKWNP